MTTTQDCEIVTGYDRQLIIRQPQHEKMSPKRRKKSRPIRPSALSLPQQGKIRTEMLSLTPRYALKITASVLTFVFGMLGLIALKPQLAVVPKEPTEKSQPFSVLFEIENTGLLSFRLERAFCYYHKVTYDRARVSATISEMPEWDHHPLESGGGETIICNLHNLIGIPDIPRSADITVVVVYRPWKIIPWPSRKYFRFEGINGDSWQWTAQPSDSIQADADKAIDRI